MAGKVPNPTPICRDCYHSPAADRYKAPAMAILPQHPPLRVKRCVVCASNLDVLLVERIPFGPAPTLALKLTKE